jgi:hypothetical protein
MRSPLGAVIQPNVKIAVERERTMDEGRVRAAQDKPNELPF